MKICRPPHRRSAHSEEPTGERIEKEPGQLLSAPVSSRARQSSFSRRTWRFAVQSESTTAPGAGSAPTPVTTLQSTAQPVPFNEMLHHSHNPFDAYRGKIVPPPSMANSLRLNSLVRDGKLYLSLRNAIDLALENNLDLVIARYNLPIAQMDILRTQAGGFTRGVNTGVVSGTPGGAASGTGTGSGAGGTSTGSGGAGAGQGGLVQSTFGVGTNVSSYDPFITAQCLQRPHLAGCTEPDRLGRPRVRTRTKTLQTSAINSSFQPGTYFEGDWNNNRQTSNSPNNTLNPQLYANVQFILSATVARRIRNRSEPALSTNCQDQPEDWRHRIQGADYRDRHADLRYLLGPCECLRHRAGWRALGCLCHGDT